MDVLYSNNLMEGDAVVLKPGLDPDILYKLRGGEIQSVPSFLFENKNRILVVTNMYYDGTIKLRTFDNTNIGISDMYFYPHFFRKVNNLKRIGNLGNIYRDEVLTIRNDINVGEYVSEDYRFYINYTDELEKLSGRPLSFIGFDGINRIVKVEDQEGKSYEISRNLVCKLSEIKLENKKEIIKNNLENKKEIIKNNNEEKVGNVKMSRLNESLKKMFGDFGTIRNDEAALTFSGKVAIKRNNGDFVRYDEDTESIENQMNFVMSKSSEFMFLMPSVEVFKGDIIKSKGKYYQVLDVKDNGSLKAVYFQTGAKCTILKETNILGMSFYTKVISLMNSVGNQINPMLMLLMNKDDNKELDMTSLMMLSGMFGGQNNNMQMNPMMMMAMLDGDKSSMSEMLPMMILFGGMNGNQNNLFGNITNNQSNDNGLVELCSQQASTIEMLQKQIESMTKPDNVTDQNEKSSDK